ncbi:MAG: AsmA-like C-terminal domain-containing protein, partial [Nitrospinae bacterium]|nr:AsmA-like C-terminal domain-containing protein [Nitrospinota bacterium]
AALEQPEKLLQQSSGQLDFNITKVSLSGANPLQIEPLEGTGKWSQGIFSPDIKGTTLGSGFGLKGEFSTQNIKADLNWKDLNINLLSLPKTKSWSPQSGIVSGTLNVDGPLPETGKPLPTNLKGKLNFQFRELVLAQANKLEKITLPRLEGNGDYENNKVNYQLIGDIFDGNFKSNGEVSILKQPILDNQIEFSNLDLSKLNLLQPGVGIPTQGKASGTIKAKGPIPENGNLDNIKVETSFRVTNLSVPMEHNQKLFPLEIPELKGSANLVKNQLSHDIQAQILGGHIRAAGNLKMGSPVFADTTINIKTIDISSLDPFLPSAFGTVSGDIKIKGPLPDSGKSLSSNLHIDTNFDLENVSMPVEIATKTVNAEISRFKGSASLNNNQLKHDVIAKLLGGNVAVKGNLSLKKNGTPEAVDTNIQLEHIDLAWVQSLKKGDWIPTSGKLSSNLQIKGPLPEGKDSPINLRAAGTLTASKLALGTGEKKNAIETAKLTLKDNSKEFIQALIEIDKINAAGLQLKKIQSNFNINPKQIDLIEGRVFPQNGQLKLKGNFQPPSGNYKLEFQGDKLKIEDFVKQLAGPLNLQGKLTGKLPENSTEFPDIAKELSGQVKIDMKDGTLPELGVLKTLLTILNPTTALQANKVGLNYESLGGDFKIVKGLVHTDNFEMESPQINLQVVGEANLGTDTVNAQVKAMPLQMLDKAIKAVPLLGNILTGGKKGGVIETYFKVDGKLSAPNVTAQAHRSLTEKPGQILNELINIPGNLTGGSK